MPLYLRSNLSMSEQRPKVTTGTTTWYTITRLALTHSCHQTCPWQGPWSPCNAIANPSVKSSHVSLAIPILVPRSLVLSLSLSLSTSSKNVRVSRNLRQLCSTPPPLPTISTACVALLSPTGRLVSNRFSVVTRRPMEPTSSENHIYAHLFKSRPTHAM